MSPLLRTKAINADHHLEDTGLRRCLGPLDLTLMGIGAIIGAGIFVLTGVAAATHAGPGIVLSYVVAGLACASSAPWSTRNWPPASAVAAAPTAMPTPAWGSWPPGSSVGI